MQSAVLIGTYENLPVHVSHHKNSLLDYYITKKAKRKSLRQGDKANFRVNAPIFDTKQSLMRMVSWPHSFLITNVL